jgi:transcriptional regulator with XRE-family HTH domain
VGEAFLFGVGKRIRERRKALRLSQEELAESTGMSKQTVSRAENAQRELGAGNLAKIANALEVSSDYLLTGKQTGDDVLLLNQKVTGLTGRQFKYLEELVTMFIKMCDEGIV